MTSPLSFSEIFQKHWKQGCDFVVTVNAHRPDYLLWPSVSLKMAAKNCAEEVTNNLAQNAAEIYSSLPLWICAELKKGEVFINLSGQQPSACVVVRLKTGLDSELAVRLLSWAILKNCDLHILDSSPESGAFYENIKAQPKCIGSSDTEKFDWLIFSADTFMSEVLCRTGSDL